MAPKARPADERFDEKWVVDPVSGCHIWIAGKESGGYGSFRVGPRNVTAHQYAWERKFGRRPPGLVLDHFVCDNRACCNPDHVRPVTSEENVKRSEKYVGTRSSCLKGHPYSPDNVRIDGRGRRECLACARAHQELVRTRRLIKAQADGTNLTPRRRSEIARHAAQVRWRRVALQGDDQ